MFIDCRHQTDHLSNKSCVFFLSFVITLNVRHASEGARYRYEIKYDGGISCGVLYEVPWNSFIWFKDWTPHLQPPYSCRTWRYRKHIPPTPVGSRLHYGDWSINAVRDVITLQSNSHTKTINTPRGQNGEVRTATTGL
jgi:hypothetical protein